MGAAPTGTGLSPVLLAPMLLILVSFVTYHLVTKGLRADINPFLFLMPVYAVALAVSAALAFLPGMTPTGGTGLASRDLMLALLLGLALVGIEAGFILAYRAGWAVSLAPTVANVAVALVLLPIALLVLREKVSLVNLAGLGLAVLGLILMAQRS